MKAIGIIPVRLESSRLPEKALSDICGMPMILHTMKRTQMAQSLNEVYVATDSPKIAKLVRQNGGRVIMTSSKHNNGTERIAEAAYDMEADIIVNIQGDEALVFPENIDANVDGLVNSDAEAAILLTKYKKKNSPSDIKAVINLNNEIIYISRTDIPSNARVEVNEYNKCYHIVSFRKDFLMKYAKMPQTPLEKIEYNEYLRIIENGYKIQGVFVENETISVDTIDDLNIVREKMKTDILFNSYRK